MKKSALIFLISILTVTLVGCKNNDSSELSSSSSSSSEIIADLFSDSPVLRAMAESLPVGELSQAQADSVMELVNQNDAYPNRLTYTLKEINKPGEGNADLPYFLTEKTTQFIRYDEPILYAETSETTIEYTPTNSEENSEISFQEISTEIASRLLIYTVNNEGTKLIVQLDEQSSPNGKKTAKATTFSTSKLIEKMSLVVGETFITEYNNILSYLDGDYWFSERQISLVKYEKKANGDIVLNVGLFARQWAEALEQNIIEHPGVLIDISIVIHDGMVAQVNLINSFMKASWTGYELSSESSVNVPIFTGEYSTDDMVYGYAETYSYAREDVGDFGIENLWNIEDFTSKSE